jgi:hypothetical protein
MRSLLAGALVMAAGAASAQNPTGQPSSANGSELLARVKIAETQVRCFASLRSPLFVDRLVEGQVVAVGPVVGEAGEFREVRLPGGVTGFVHKTFSTEPKDGYVQTTRPNVAFRYRPQTGEAPVVPLEKDTPLRYLGEEGEWWRVRCERVPGYLLVAELDLFPEPNPTLTASAGELKQVREKEWQDAVATRDAKLAESAALTAIEAKLDDVERRLVAESQRPTGEQDLGPIRQELDALVPSIPAGTPAVERGAMLQSKLRMQQLALDAAKLIATPPANDPRATEVVEPRVPDRLSFDATGWIRRKSGHGELSEYRLEKGGKLLLYVDCRSGRYDLRLFEGCEVGIQGVLSRPDAESVRVVDVAKLHVLSTAK